jgi:hypothetical protein
MLSVESGAEPEEREDGEHIAEAELDEDEAIEEGDLFPLDGVAKHTSQEGEEEDGIGIKGAGYLTGDVAIREEAGNPLCVYAY